MRKLKFRTWNDKEMRTDFSVNSDGSNTANDRWIIMQFTGLLDKNGIEIYEGDIIYLNKDKNYKTTCVVTFGEYDDNEGYNWYKHLGFYLKINEDGKRSLVDNFNEIEVIGNIYENPELLIKEL